MILNYAEIKKFDIANAPRVSSTIFFSGCTHKCKGCFNKCAWDFNYGNKFTDEEIDKVINYLDHDYIAGLSLLGGEPLEPQNQEGLLPLVRKVKEKFPKAIAHISASGGTLNREYFDAVRVGIMLYGYYPYEVKKPSIKVKPIMSVYAPVVKNRALEKNSPIMYGDFLTKEDINASIIRFGYADGLPRKSVYGQLNNRCMDLTAVKNDTKNKYFCILRKNAHEISKKYGTISYEVLTSISKRAKRIYKR